APESAAGHTDSCRDRWLAGTNPVRPRLHRGWHPQPRRRHSHVHGLGGGAQHPRAPADRVDHRAGDQDRRQDLPAGAEARPRTVSAGRGMVGTPDKIAIIDFGGQYTQLIARRIRELSVYSEIIPCGESMETVLAGGYCGIVLSGGPSSVYEDGAPLPAKALFSSGIPILGICYGMQAMGYLLVG